MIDIAGGVYREICHEPFGVDEVFGSGGRAAAAISGLCNDITLHTFANKEGREFAEEGLEAVFNFDLKITKSTQLIHFEYFHCLSQPRIFPSLDVYGSGREIEISGETILRFGFLEGDAKVAGEWVVYDPQSEEKAVHFHDNGSTATHLALIANETEITQLSGQRDLAVGADLLISNNSYEVVVVKRGPKGVLVCTADHKKVHVPSFRTEKVWKIGSGDIFSGIFSFYWGIEKLTASEAAFNASIAAAFYCRTRCSQIPELSNIDENKYPSVPTDKDISKRQVYLAGPFFNVSQKWLISEAKRCLESMGIKVFSPSHAVGIGGTDTEIAAKDLNGLRKSDCVLALIDGTDPGTIFEIGYAYSKRKPVIALAENVPEGDLTMISGANCVVIDDFATAIYETIWQILEL